jgi:hypothetical protein
MTLFKKRTYRAVFLGVLAMLALILGGVSVSADNEPIIMKYGEIYRDNEFDATAWFENGMYQPRKFYVYGGREESTDLTMLRVSVPPFPDSDLVDLRAWLVAGLNPVTHSIPELWPPPENYERILMNKHFDPRPQIQYSYSYFIEPNKPIDVFDAYLLLEGKRFYVSLKRDALTGEINAASRLWATEIPEEEEDVLMRQMEISGRHGIFASGGGRCPKTGWWTFSGKPESTRYYPEGETMNDYKIPGFWQWIGEKPPVDSNNKPNANP